MECFGVGRSSLREAVLDAIQARDSVRAQKAIRDHLESVGERLTDALLEKRAE